MAIIYTYPRKSTAEAGDLVVISDSSDSNKTKQLTLQSIADYIDGEVTLQEVLNTGSKAVNDGNTWNGLFRLDDTNPVGSNPQFIVDMNGTSGSGSSVVYIVGKLETSLGSDAAFGNDIAVANNATIDGNLLVNGTSTFVGSLDLDDAATELKFQSDAGTATYVAQSNGAGAAPSWGLPWYPVITRTKRFEVTDDRGTNNVTFGLGSFSNAIAGAIQNVVVGRNAGTAISAEDNSVILGDSAGSGPAIGNGNVLIGANAGSSTTNTSATDNTMIGRDTGSNLTTGEDNVFIGAVANNTATNNAGSRNVIVGHSSTANGNNAVVLGYANSAASSTNLQGDKMVVIGSNISAQNGSNALGSQTSVTIGAGDNNAAKALLNEATGAVLIGNNIVDNKGITANAPDSIGIGTSVNIDAESGTAIGTLAEVLENSTNAIAIGNAAQIPADGEYSIAIGSGSRGRGESAVSIGNGAGGQDGFSHQICIGTSARTLNGNENVAIGNNAAATAGSFGSALALMPNSVASAQYAMAIGTNSDATQENAIALGTNGQATDYAQQINIRNTAQGNLPQYVDRAAAIAAGLRDGDLYVLAPGGPDNPGTSFVLAIF